MPIKPGICALIDMATKVYTDGHVKNPEQFAARIEETTGKKLDPAAATALWRMGIENHRTGRTASEISLAEFKKKAAKTVADLQVSTNYEFVSGLVRTGLLSPVRTFQASLVGNAGAALADGIARLPATLVARTAAKAMGHNRRVILPPQLKQVAKMKVTSEAAQEWWDTIVHGASKTDVARYDMNRLIAPKGAHFRQGLAWFINKQMDLISAADKPGRIYAWKEAYAEAAVIQAMNEFEANGQKPRGAEFDARVDEIMRGAMNVESAVDVLATMADRSEIEQHGQLITHANEQETILILANPNLASNALTGVKRRIESDVGEWWQLPVDLQAPFVKIPTNAILRGAEYSGIPGLVWGGVNFGRAKKLYNQARAAEANEALTPSEKKKLVADLTRKGDKALRHGSLSTGRAITGGMGFFWVGWAFYEAFTEPRDPDRDRRAVQYAAGEGQGGIRLPDWLGGGSYSLVDLPQFMPFIMGAQARRMWENTEVQSLKAFAGNYVDSVGGVGVGTMLDIPTMRGVSDTHERFRRYTESSDEGKLIEDTLRDWSGWVVPSWLTDIGRARDQRNMRMSDGLSDRMRAETPGEMENLPIRYDAFGRPAQRGSIAIRNYDMPVEGEEDRIVKEAMDLGIKMSVAYKPPGMEEGEYNLWDTSNYQRMVGQIRWGYMQAVMNHPSYDSLSRAQKIVNLKWAVKTGRERATELWKNGIRHIDDEILNREEEQLNR